VAAAERCGCRHHPGQATCGAIVLLMAAAFVAATAARALRGAVPAAACRRRGGGSAAAPSTAPAAFRWGVGSATMASEAAPRVDGAFRMPLRRVLVHGVARRGWQVIGLGLLTTHSRAIDVCSGAF